MRRKTFFTIFLVALVSFQTWSQSKGVFTDSNRQTLSALGSGDISITMPSGMTLPVMANDGYVLAKFDFGTEYDLGKSTGPNQFEFKVDFLIKGFSGAIELFSEPNSITVTNARPEAAIQRGLDDYFDELQSNGLSIDRIEVSQVTTSDELGTSSALALSRLEIELSYSINLGIDVRGFGSGINGTSVAVNVKTGTFNWTSDHDYPNYQLQVLRLYNTDELLVSNEAIVEADVNWELAVNFETESNATSLIATISEGTGVYAWRVRPIGTYFENGIGNNNNWGEWSNAISGTVTNTTGQDFFYFDEPDDDVNFIYNRSFTEGNKQSEQITYADGLQNVRQSQAYLPSKNTTVTSQSIQDHLGRTALTTLPVPEVQKLEGYKEGFVSGFNIEDFDSDGTVDNPSSMDLPYYDGTNNIADAQGFPYTRTRFFNDGTGRIKEASGIGIDHKLGSGHTTRTMYGTASEDELVALFGKEAPKPENVQKVITIDPNNTATVSFVSKEGNTIATGLTFLENDNADGTNAQFEKLDDVEPTKIPVKDVVTKNVDANDGFISSKKLVLAEPSPLTPAYRIRCKTLENLCTDVELSCGYKVTVIIHNLDDPSKDIRLSKDLTDLDCEIADDGFEYKNVAAEDWVVEAGDITSGTGIVLDAGIYQIEKLLVSEAEPEAIVTDAKDRIDLQIKPLQNWIEGALGSIECDEQMIAFYHDLVTLGNAFEDDQLASLVTVSGDDYVFTMNCDGCTGSSVSFSQEYWDLYTNPDLHDDFQLLVVDLTAQRMEDLPLEEGKYPIAAYINTPCCEIVLDVRYTPPFTCPPSFGRDATLSEAPGNDPTKAEINKDYIHAPENTEVFPDFEGYAISILTECFGDAAAAETEFYDFMGGWLPGEFNDMVLHMLTDQYSCDASGNNEDPGIGGDGDGPDLGLDACGNPIDPLNNPGAVGQYACDDLAACWTGIVMTLKSVYCGEIDMDELNADGNVSEGVDDNNEGDGDPHDSHMDDSFEGSGLLMKWLAKKAISKRFRELSDGGEAGPPDSRYNLHLVEEFFRCTGYKFADVILPQTWENTDGQVFTNDDYPHESPEKPELAYDFDELDLNYDVDGGQYLVGSHIEDALAGQRADFQSRVAYFDVKPDPENPGQMIIDPTFVSEIFPNILHPVYAFKYFEYGIGEYPDLEAGVCYSDPNDCRYWNGSDWIFAPCCVPNPLDAEANWDMTFCFEDEDHPSLGDDPAPGEHKLIVQNFCGMGQVVCPYTKPDWNCGQRATFFQMLKNYYEQPSDWNDVVNFDCDFMHQDFEWFANPTIGDVDENDEPVCGLEIAEVTVGLMQQECPDYVSDLPSDPLEFTDLEGNDVTSISFLERQFVRKITNCEDKCEDRRDEFRSAIVTMFQNRCYTIADCKAPGADNVVLSEDIETLTDQVVDQCNSQCPVTTYTCESRECRLYNTPKTIFGKNDVESVLELGTGGHVDELGLAIDSDCIAAPGALMQSCCNNAGNWGAPCNSASLYNLSFSEYTKVKQVHEWDINLDIETMCNSNGEFVDGDPRTHYYLGNGNLDSHTLTDCSGGNTDTFVERDEYEKKSYDLDAIKAFQSEPVESPHVQVVLDVDEQ